MSISAIVVVDGSGLLFSVLFPDSPLERGCPPNFFAVNLREADRGVYR